MCFEDSFIYCVYVLKVKRHIDSTYGNKVAQKITVSTFGI